MSSSLENKIDKIPILSWTAKVLKQVKLPGFEGLSAFDLLEMYVIGIFKGALTTRASAIAFSFLRLYFHFYYLLLF